MENAAGKMISKCGLICGDCPALIATQAGDEQKIAEIAAQWSKQFNAEIPPESVWCDGCIVEGRKCGHCHECDVRSCAMEKNMDNCGVCTEYRSCKTIADFMKIAPMVKEVLDSIAGK